MSARRLVLLALAAALLAVPAAAPAASKPKPERCGGKHQPRCLAFSTKSPRRAADALLGAIESAGTRRTLRLPTVKKQLGRRGAAALALGRRRAAAFARASGTTLGTKKGKGCPKGKVLGRHDTCVKKPKKRKVAKRAAAAALPTVPTGQQRPPVRMSDLLIEDGGATSPTGQGKGGEGTTATDRVTKKNGSYLERSLSLQTPVQRCPSENGLVLGVGEYQASFTLARRIGDDLSVVEIELATEAKWQTYTDEAGSIGEVVTDGGLRDLRASISRWTEDPRSGRRTGETTESGTVRWSVDNWPYGGTHPSVYGGSEDPEVNAVANMGVKLIDLVWAQAKSSYAQAQKFWLTPNNCVRVHLDPESGALRPGQSTRVDASVRPVSLPGVTVAPKGAYAAAASPGASVAPGAGRSEVKPFPFTFRAPAAKWTEAGKPVMTVKLTSKMGRAEERLAFPGVDFPVRFRVLSAGFRTHASGSGPHVFCGSQSGTRDFSSTSSTPSDDDRADELTLGYQDAVEGNVSTKVPAVFSNQDHVGCEIDDEGHKVPCHRSTPNRTYGGDGKTTIGFSVDAAGPGAATAGLHWFVPDPEIGYVDAYNESCFVHMLAHLPLDREKTTVPTRDLFAPGPHTFTLAGSATLPGAVTGGTMTYTWNYTMTIERIP